MSNGQQCGTKARARDARWWWLMAVLAVLWPTSADAQTAPLDEPDDAQWSVQPSGPAGPGNRDWFSYTLEPGAVFGDVVAISNLGTRPIRFVIYATDVHGVKDVGGLAPQRDDEAATDVGTWIRLADTDYVVEPGTRIDVPFSVTVPADAEPGDHVGAILAIDADDARSEIPDGNGTEFNVRTRVGARIYVRVSGPVTPAIQIEDMSVERDGGRATIAWDISNTGNVRLVPSAEVRITGFLGREIARLPIQELPEILPDGNYVGASIAEGLPRFEQLNAHLVITADGVEVKGSTSFGSYPWLLIALLAGIVATAYAVRRRRRSRREPSLPPQPRPDRQAVGV
jgi:hypothetical protein